MRYIILNKILGVCLEGNFFQTKALLILFLLLFSIFFLFLISSFVGSDILILLMIFIVIFITSATKLYSIYEDVKETDFKSEEVTVTCEENETIEKLNNEEIFFSKAFKDADLSKISEKNIKTNIDDSLNFIHVVTFNTVSDKKNEEMLIKCLMNQKNIVYANIRFFEDALRKETNYFGKIYNVYKYEKTVIFNISEDGRKTVETIIEDKYIGKETTFE